MLFKGAIQEVRDPSSLAFYSRLLLEASNRIELFKSLSGLPHLQDGNYSVHQKLPSSWPVDNFSGPQGCILPHFHGSFCSQTAQISGLGQIVSVCSNAFWPSYSSQGVHYLSQGSEEDDLEVGHLSSHVPRRLAYQGQQLSRGSFSNSNFVGVDSQAGVNCKQGEVRLASKASVHLPGPGFRPVQGCLLSNRGQVPVHSGLNLSSAFQPLYYSKPGYAPFGSSSFHREDSTSGSPSHATPSVLSQETLQLPPERCPGFSFLLRPFSEGSSKVVVTKEQCHGTSSTAPTQICNIHLHGCLSSGLGSSLCSHDCPRSMVDSAVQTAHQCFGAQGCAPGPQDQVASDNTTVCAYINKQGGTRSWDMFALTWHLFAFCHKNKVVLSARHVPGVMNLVADQLSRSHQTLHTEWSLNPQVFRWLSQIDFQPQIDLLQQDSITRLWQ